MLYGKKVEIDLTKCNINSIIEDDKVKQIISIKLSENGSSLNFTSTPLNITLQNLQEKINKKPHTYLYINKKKPSEFYFDLENILK